MNEFGFLTCRRIAEKMLTVIAFLMGRDNISARTAEGSQKMRTTLLTCGLIAVAALAPTIASAQNQNRNNAGSGNTGGLSSVTGGAGASNPFAATGGSGAGSTGFGGQNGLGLNGQTGLGTNGQAGFGGQNQLGANGNNGGILGRNTNQNQFLGRNAQNQGVGGNNGQGGGRGGGGNRRTGQESLNGGGGANGGNANQSQLVRPRLEVGFDFPKPKTGNIQVALETRLTKLAVKTPGMKSITVAVEDKGEVILRGEVGSESESKLAVELLRLEPGVQSIRSELTFPAAEPAAE